MYCTAYTGIYRTYPGEESDLVKKIGGERDSPSPENVSSFDSERDNIIRLLCCDSRTLHFYWNLVALVCIYRHDSADAGVRARLDHKRTSKSESNTTPNGMETREQWEKLCS